MFEYGAPLVAAWRDKSPAHHKAFLKATEAFSSLMPWITNISDGRPWVTANLCSLSSLEHHFQRFKTAYILALEQTSSTNLLQRLLSAARPGVKSTSFAWALHKDKEYEQFKISSSLEPTVKTALGRYLRTQLKTSLVKKAQGTRLLNLIPFESRKVPGLRFADVSLAASPAVQRLLFQYRWGVFMHNTTCAC